LQAGFDSQLTLNCSFPIFNYCPGSQWRCSPYKATFASFNLIRRYVPLKELVSWLKKGAICPIFEGDMPPKKRTSKYNAASGIIAGELLREDPLSPGILDMFFSKLSYHVSLYVKESVYT
jgi:hypothetical protein